MTQIEIISYSTFSATTALQNKFNVEWGFEYGESEYEVSFGIAPRNGDLSPSDPETPELFSSPFRARNPKRSSYWSSPHNLGSVSQNLGSRSICTKR